MTSNIGTREIKKDLNYGFALDDDKTDHEKIKGKIGDELKRLFNPEFLNRVDDIIFFKQLENEEALKIVDLSLDELLVKLKDRNIEFQLSEGAKKFIADKAIKKVIVVKKKLVNIVI